MSSNTSSSKENAPPAVASNSNVNNNDNAEKKSTMSIKTFERGYEALVEYKEKHGNVNIPYRCDENKALGIFVAKMRKTRDELTEDQRHRLNELGFDWESTQDRAWNSKFERLRQYFEKFGNSLVPTSYKDDSELGEWVAKQRQKFTQGRLPLERQEKLNSVHFVYRINKFIQRKATPREDQKWLGQFEKLLMFSLEWGHTLVPFQYKGDKSLGRWVNEQRCNNIRGLLKETRKTLLDQIGFVWKVTGKDDKSTIESKDPAFDAMFRQLVEYKVTYGSFDRINTNKKDSSSPLGKWVAAQKESFQAGTMDEMRALRFVAIGFCSDETAEMFDKYMSKLKGIDCGTIGLDEPCLVVFCIIQRYLSQKGKLSQERRQKLETIGLPRLDTEPFDLPMPESRYVSRESSIASVIRNKPKNKKRTTIAATKKAVVVKTTKKRAAQPQEEAISFDQSILKSRVLPHKKRTKVMLPRTATTTTTKEDTFDDSTISSSSSSSDGSSTLDTTVDTSMERSMEYGSSSPTENLVLRNNSEGYMGLFALALDYKSRKVGAL